MKTTTRDEWRVMVTLRPQHPDHLGLTGVKGLAEFVAPAGPITVAVLPRQLGQLSAGMLVPDDKTSSDIAGDYRRRCEEMATELLRLPHVDEATVTCTETHTCSHCGLEWEVLTAEEALDREIRLDAHSDAGEPVCCDKAIAEFRQQRGIPQYLEGVVAFRNPDRPGVLLCRKHGQGWSWLTPLTAEDLPDGGTCTHGDPTDPTAECGRDVLIPEAGGAV